ncbi:MAG TPA: DUF2786 domain-containing protein [Pseudonocardia sp.]|nr:DUF2786 domain-containing protein [Pseudonocardia sp.]
MSFWEQQRQPRRDPGPTVPDVAAAMARIADRYLDGPDWALRQVTRLLGVDASAGAVPVSPLFARASDLALVEALGRCWQYGWQPVDVWEVLRRRQHEAGAAFAVGAIAAESTRHAEVAMHPRWRRQLAELGATVWWPSDSPYCAAWARREGVDVAGMLAVVLEALAHLRRLPAQPVLIPPPGSPDLGAPATGATAGATAGAEVDPKVLAKVRALLAKAESTSFPEEADAFFAKAQELMTRYSLERAAVDALADPAGGIPVRTAGRRIWLDNPYLSAKSMLVGVAAEANRCRAVFASALGLMTVIGEETDTEVVEVLTTSLLVQAGRAMLAAGGRVDRRGQSRTRSFRQSFLVSYAQRIGERLAEAAAGAESAVIESIGDGRLLPVLAAREQAVQQRVDELFPQLVKRRVSVSNPAGWAEGRAAADLAVLDVRRAVEN